MSSIKSSVRYFAVITFSFFLIIISNTELMAQGKIRIGVYDSRAVAIAFYNSKYSNVQQIFGDIKKRMAEAKEKNNEEEIKNVEYEANLRQAFLHEQVFGKGSVNAIMDTIKGKIAVISEKEGLDILVSKWELHFHSPYTEIIDVTEKITDLFEPDERIKAMLKELNNQEPITDAYLIKD